MLIFIILTYSCFRNIAYIQFSKYIIWCWGMQNQPFQSEFQRRQAEEKFKQDSIAYLQRLRKEREKKTPKHTNTWCYFQVCLYSECWKERRSLCSVFWIHKWLIINSFKVWLWGTANTNPQPEWHSRRSTWVSCFKQKECYPCFTCWRWPIYSGTLKTNPNGYGQLWNW